MNILWVITSIIIITGSLRNKNNDLLIFQNDKINNLLKPILIKIGYNLIYIFSICQIQYNKFLKKIEPNIVSLKK